MKRIFVFFLFVGVVSCVDLNPVNSPGTVSQPSATIDNGISGIVGLVTPDKVIAALLPRVGEVSEDGTIVKSRSVMTLYWGPDQNKQIVGILANTTNIPISVVNAVSTAVTVDSSKFVMPPIKSEVLGLGKISLSALSDNNLAVCGANGKTQCTTAIIRMYTVGTAGAGIYNAADGYGAPLSGGQVNPLEVIGLNLVGAGIMQSVTIAANKHVLKLSDFPNPAYVMQADLSNAGAGTYTTTLVVEYALSA